MLIAKLQLDIVTVGGDFSRTRTLHLSCIVSRNSFCGKTKWGSHEYDLFSFFSELLVLHFTCYISHFQHVTNPYFEYLNWPLSLFGKCMCVILLEAAGYIIAARAAMNSYA